MPETTVSRRATAMPLTAGLLALLYCAVVLWTPGRSLDQELLAVTQQVAGSATARTAELLQVVMSPIDVSLAALALLGWGVLRRRAREALVALLALVLAVVAAESLKLGILSRPVEVGGLPVSLLPGTGSFPSGHVTVAAALGLAVVRMPATRRATADVLVWSLVAVVAAGVVVAGWHRPGDAVAGVLVAVIARQVADIVCRRWLDRAAHGRAGHGARAGLRYRPGTMTGVLENAPQTLLPSSEELLSPQP